MLDQLRAQKVNVVTLPRVPATLEQMYANIRQLAKTLQVPEQGEALVTQINQRPSEYSKTWRPKSPG